MVVDIFNSDQTTLVEWLLVITYIADDRKEKYINPYTDFGFKKLFGTEMNKDLLISFLNALFHDKQVVKDV